MLLIFSLAHLHVKASKLGSKLGFRLNYGLKLHTCFSAIFAVIVTHLFENIFYLY